MPGDHPCRMRSPPRGRSRAPSPRGGQSRSAPSSRCSGSAPATVRRRRRAPSRRRRKVEAAAGAGRRDPAQAARRWSRHGHAVGHPTVAGNTLRDGRSTRKAVEQGDRHQEVAPRVADRPRPYLVVALQVDRSDLEQVMRLQLAEDLRALPHPVARCAFASEWEATDFIGGTPNSCRICAAVREAPSFAARSNTLRWLCVQFFGSPDFNRLDQRTQYTRRRMIEAMLNEPVAPGALETFADFPIDRLTPKALRVLRDRKAGRPGAADNRVRALRGLFKWAVRNELCKQQSCARRRVCRWQIGRLAFVDTRRTRAI